MTDFVPIPHRRDEFVYDASQNKYWSLKLGIILEANAVDALVGRDQWTRELNPNTGNITEVKPSQELRNVDLGTVVATSTWWPGKPQLIADTIFTNDGPIPSVGDQAFNTYRPPNRNNLRDDKNADMWIEHVKRLYPNPDEHEHFFDWAAHAIQAPHTKPGHGVVLAGRQGIGKDTMLHPIRVGVGECNVSEISPDDINSSFNPYVRSVLLIINEVRPQKEDHHASNFYNMLKVYLCGPPLVLPMNLKFQNTVYVKNVCHTVMTTNELISLHIPDEDRRLFIMRSKHPKIAANDTEMARYFTDVWNYLEDGGTDAVIRWLLRRDLSRFNPNSHAPWTDGKRSVIVQTTESQKTLLDEVFEDMIECNPFWNGEPPTVFFPMDMINFMRSPFGAEYKDEQVEALLKLMKTKHGARRFEQLGYYPVKNPDDSRGRWQKGGFTSATAQVLLEADEPDLSAALRAELEKRPWDWSVVVKSNQKPREKVVPFDHGKSKG